jgi:hypothetical protein
MVRAGPGLNARDHQKGYSAMSDMTTLGELFDRWEWVWHEGQYDLISSCIGPTWK